MKIGFAGFGNMAQAMAKGIRNNFRKIEIYATGGSYEKLLQNTEKLNIIALKGNEELPKKCDVIIMAVKPINYEKVAEEILKGIDIERERKITVISICPSYSFKEVEELFKDKVMGIAAMPNTPVLVGEGTTLVNASSKLKDEEKDEIIKTVFSEGLVLEVNEKIIKETGSLNGCTPAFTYIFIEALSDAGVLMGLKREDAIKIAAQTVKGACEMILKTELHPGKLKDMVTSPGGTTIEGVRSLEKDGFRSAAIEAVLKARDKSLEK